MSDASKAVFLSYASQDAEAARGICETLRSAGVEVWFDQEGGLEHGDEWDAKIRRQIKECVLFIPVISANTQAREEGYFRIEWDLAAERARGIASGVAFVLPVVIDATREPDALVPDRFRAVQWTKLPGGVVSPEVQARFLKLWSHRTGVLKHESAKVDVGRNRLIPPDAGKAEYGGPALQKRRFHPALLALAILVVGAVAYFVLRSRRNPGEIAKVVATTQTVAANPTGSEARVFPRDPDLKRAWNMFFYAINASSEDFSLAEDIIKGVVARRPADPEAVIVYAWLNDSYLNRGFDLTEERFVLAQRYAERAVQLAPDDPEALGALGQFLSFRRADLPRAEQLLRRAINLNPREPRYYRALAYNVLLVTRPEEGLQVAEHAADLFPSDPLVFYELGLTYRNAGRIADMERAFDRSLTLAPIGAAMIWKAWIGGWVRGDLAEMKRWLEQIPANVRFTDRALIVRYEYACLTRQPTDLAEALRGLQAFPGVGLRDFYYTGPKALLIGDLFALQGKRELAAGQYEVARADLARAREREPDDLFLLTAELWTFVGLGRHDEALADVRLILGLEPQPYHPRFLSWWFNVVPACLLLGDRELALQHLREAAVHDAVRNQMRTALRIDPRMAPWRDDPEISALLANPDQAGKAPSSISQLPSPADAKSVAVLAFDNLSDNKENEYFSDGISEELLNVLAKIPGLKVTARTSSFYFKGRNMPVADIAQQLGVAYVVEGSVRKQGDKVRITAQLIKASDGFEIWSDKFDRELKDIFAVQDEIAGLIAKNLSLKIGVAGPAATTVNPEVLRLYFEARQLWDLRSDEALAQMEALLARALELDPRFGPAEAGLAQVWVTRAFVNMAAARYRESELANAVDHATKAIVLDPTSAEAFEALGTAALVRGQLAQAETALTRAVDLNPNYAPGWNKWGWLLARQGHLEEALEKAARAREIDPLVWSMLDNDGWALLQVERYSKATEMFARARALPVSAPVTWANGAVALLLAGRKDEALALARIVTRNKVVGQWSPGLRDWSDGIAAWVLAEAGASGEAQVVTERLLAGPEALRFAAGLALVALGREKEGYTALAGMPQQLVPYLWLLDQRHETLAADPGFKQLLAQLNATDAYQAAHATLTRLQLEKAGHQ